MSVIASSRKNSEALPLQLNRRSFLRMQSQTDGERNQFTKFDGAPLMRGFKYGILTGIIVTPIIAMDIPGRFDVPIAEKWLLVQGILGMVHSSLAGILIGLINRKAL